MTRRLILALALTFAALPAWASVCRYDVVPDATGGFADLALDVAIACTADVTPDDFQFGYGGGRHADWAPNGRLAYRVRLGRLASAGGYGDFAANRAGVFAPLGAWLAAPATRAGVEALEIAFARRDGVHTSTNLAESDGRLRLKRADWRFAGYGAFAARPPVVVTAPGPAAFAEPGREGPAAARIKIAVLSDDFAITDADFAGWIERFAGLTARFWAGFPSDRLLIGVTPGGFPGRLFGRVRGGGGATMLLRVATGETLDYLHRDDWVLTHELVHLGAPFAPTRVPWFMEGMATYLEPLIRALGGAIPEEDVWAEWLRAMPTGALGVNLGGLEGDGRPYWTGAVFFLAAHVSLARRGDALGLARCFRGMRQDLGDSASRATVTDLIRACDAAIGAPTLGPLRDRLAEPTAFNLAALFEELGATRGDDGPRFAPEGAGLRGLLFDSRQFPAPDR